MKILPTLTFLLVAAWSPLLGEVPPAAEEACRTLMEATESGDFAKFQSVGDAEFREGITEEAFARVSDQMVPVLKPGYTTEFLTELVQQGQKVYLWKITPKAGDNQFIAKVVMNGDEVTGFWIQ